MWSSKKVLHEIPFPFEGRAFVVNGKRIIAAGGHRSKNPGFLKMWTKDINSKDDAVETDLIGEDDTIAWYVFLYFLS